MLIFSFVSARRLRLLLCGYDKAIADMRQTIRLLTGSAAHWKVIEMQGGHGRRGAAMRVHLEPSEWASQGIK